MKERQQRHKRQQRRVYVTSVEIKQNDWVREVVGTRWINIDDSEVVVTKLGKRVEIAVAHAPQQREDLINV
jgi:hypothetical protein